MELKPGKNTLTNINTYEMWNYSTSISNDYNLTNQSRIITNMEWGAIAYFSFSKYAKINNINYSGSSKKLFFNNAMGDDSWNNLTTGCSSGTISGGGSKTCLYSYDIDYYGSGASSTGNIYGIYDLSGGSWECVMSIVSNNQVKKNIGGYSGDLPSDTRYYTLYSPSNDMFDYSRGIIGDATIETRSKTLVNKSWQGNLAYFATSSFPWVKRGGTFRGGKLFRII